MKQSANKTCFFAGHRFGGVSHLKGRRAGMKLYIAQTSYIVSHLKGRRAGMKQENSNKISVKSWLTHFAFLFLPVFSAQAIVLDWSGSYQVEMNFLQKGDFEEWGRSQLFHNLHLKPDIKAFDNVRVRSWFLLSAPAGLDATLSPVSGSAKGASSSPALNSAKEPTNADTADTADTLRKQRSFHRQEGIPFGLESVSQANLSAKALYLEVAHDFGLFQLGWKPHHFGLGLYYNDSSALFSPVYNQRGSRGFMAWRGSIGSAYYVSPLIHYIGESLLDLFIQGGYTQKKYGVELIYKTKSLGVKTKSNTPLQAPSYFGFHGYYKTSAFSASLEGGQAEGVYGGALDLSWQTPAKWLSLNLQSGLSTFNDTSTFYFDPSFSSGLSFLIERYEGGKEKAPEYLKQYLSYSFHSAFYLAPSAVFSFSNSLSLKTVFSTHIDYSELNILLSHVELTLQYQMEEGLVWNTSLGALFPQEDNWHLGILSQAAITF